MNVEVVWAAMEIRVLISTTDNTCSKATHSVAHSFTGFSRQYLWESVPSRNGFFQMRELMLLGPLPCSWLIEMHGYSPFRGAWGGPARTKANVCKGREGAAVVAVGLRNTSQSCQTVC